MMCGETEEGKRSRILSLIGKGEGQAISLHSLSTLSGEEERHLRKRIETYRRTGIPILSGMSGYYFPETAEEIREYIRKEEKRARSIFYTLRGAKQALSAYFAYENAIFTVSKD